MSQTGPRRLWWRHLISVLVFPATMAGFIPALILWGTEDRIADFESTLLTACSIGIGVVLVTGGLSMLVWTVVLFDKIGQGTLGAGPVMGEPVNLVVSGPYRYVRNPMITGVASILLGEAALTGSLWLAIWFVTFCLLQTVAIRFWEEPHLAKRFGNDYLYYTQNVPRWIPRTTAWNPPLKAG